MEKVITEKPPHTVRVPKRRPSTFKYLRSPPLETLESIAERGWGWGGVYFGKSASGQPGTCFLFKSTSLMPTLCQALS